MADNAPRTVTYSVIMPAEPNPLPELPRSSWNKMSGITRFTAAWWTTDDTAKE